MRPSAWATMLATWGVVVFFTVKFFLMVVRKSGPGGRAGDR